MIIEISMVIIAAFIVIFVSCLLIVLMQFRRTAKEAEKFLDTARQQIAPLSHDLTIVLNDSKKIVQSIERQTEKVETGVDALKDTALNVKNFETEIQQRIEQPILEITALVSAVAKILNSLFQHLKKDDK